MATNPYFNKTTVVSEQNLYEKLTIESIKMYGYDMIYIPREKNKIDKILGDIVQSTFENDYTIEMYLQTVNGWEGDNEMIAKFGLEIKDSCKFIVSKKRFKQITTLDKPKNGDMLYFPFTKILLVIKNVDFENPFYQLGKLYTFGLSCETYQYSQEDISTGNMNIDQVQRDQAYQFPLTLTAGGANDFATGDQVYQGSQYTPVAAGTVTRWDATNKKLYVRNVVGHFEIWDGTGSPSSSQDYSLYKVNGAGIWYVSDNYDEMPWDVRSTSKEFQDKGKDILFNTSNPFGEP